MTKSKKGIDYLLDAHNEKLTRASVKELLSYAESLTEAVEALSEAADEWEVAERDERDDARDAVVEASTQLLMVLDDWRVPEGVFNAS